MSNTELQSLLKQVRACRICDHHLPLGPRPIVRMAPSAQLLIIGQAPGTRVHESGIPWDDKSGDRLRDWLNIDKDTFYDKNRIAIMPMGFCFPGTNPKGGDNPPRPECAPEWHDRLKGHLPNIKLTLLVGTYAQSRYLGKSAKKTMTETVRTFRDYLPDGFLPTPHPSWRTVGWAKKNPWFEEEILPVLREHTKPLMS